jgi:hypothetical protein
MNFFEFECREIVDENLTIKLGVEPVGDMYSYSLSFESDQASVPVSGIAKPPLLALVKLRNLLVATLDSLSDSVEMTKVAATHIESYNTLSDEMNNQDEDEDEDEPFIG